MAHSPEGWWENTLSCLCIFLQRVYSHREEKRRTRLLHSGASVAASTIRQEDDTSESTGASMLPRRESSMSVSPILAVWTSTTEHMYCGWGFMRDGRSADGGSSKGWRRRGGGAEESKTAITSCIGLVAQAVSHHSCLHSPLPLQWWTLIQFTNYISPAVHDRANLLPICGLDRIGSGRKQQNRSGSQ